MRRIGRLLDGLRLFDDFLGILIVLHVADVQLVQSRLQLFHLGSSAVGPLVGVIRFLVDLRK